MKGLWTKNWKKALIWLCGYVHLIAFAITGGYVIAKSTDKELHRTAKTVFIVTLIFTAVEAVILILSGIASLGGKYGDGTELDQVFRDARQDRRICRGTDHVAV